MATCSARKTAAFLSSSSSQCVRSKIIVPHLLAPSQRRCLHQEPETHQPGIAATTAGLSYKPFRQRFVAPFPVKPQKPYPVNDDPKKLDEMYQKLLGEDLGLSEEVKWQAVTHKSFDHAWQGFNEKLAFFGKKVVLMHTSLGLLNTRPKALGPPKEKDNSSPALTAEDPNVLKPFRHPDYKYLTYITTKNVREVLETKKLSGLAYRVGMERVMRWKPAFNSDPTRSGQGIVAANCIYAIVGAVALQKGGDVAGRVVRDRILAQMESISR